MSVSRQFPPFVYFVRRSDGEGPVKIGCSQIPEERLSTLMQWSPYPLVVAARIGGDERLERAFHAKFAAQHSHREWFLPSAELHLTIAQVSAGSFDIGSLPPPQCVTRPMARTGWPEATKRRMSWIHQLRHLRNRGVEVPPEIRHAAERGGYGRYHPDFIPNYDANATGDAALVEAWLSGNTAVKAA